MEASPVLARSAVADALVALDGRVEGYEFGREGSPVLYVILRTVDDLAERDQFLAELREAFVKGLSADEFDLDDHRESVRIWWD